MTGKKGRSGGARRGAGPNVRRIHISADAALELKILTLNQRALRNNPNLTPHQLVEELIHGLWLAYDAMIQEAAEEGAEHVA